MKTKLKASAKKSLMQNYGYWIRCRRVNSKRFGGRGYWRMLNLQDFTRTFKFYKRIILYRIPNWKFRTVHYWTIYMQQKQHKTPNRRYTQEGLGLHEKINGMLDLHTKIGRIKSSSLSILVDCSQWQASSISTGDLFHDHYGFQTLHMLKCLVQNAFPVHITWNHSPVYFKSSLDP